MGAEGAALQAFAILFPVVVAGWGAIEARSAGLRIANIALALVWLLTVIVWLAGRNKTAPPGDKDSWPLVVLTVVTGLFTLVMVIINMRAGIKVPMT